MLPPRHHTRRNGEAKDPVDEPGRQRWSWGPSAKRTPGTPMVNRSRRSGAGAGTGTAGRQPDGDGQDTRRRSWSRHSLATRSTLGDHPPSPATTPGYDVERSCRVAVGMGVWGGSRRGRPREMLCCRNPSPCLCRRPFRAMTSFTPSPVMATTCPETAVRSTRPASVGFDPALRPERSSTAWASSSAQAATPARRPAPRIRVPHPPVDRPHGGVCHQR